MHNTTEKSVFTIKTASKQETSVGDIIVGNDTDANGLKAIIANTTDLRGNITIYGSVGKIKMDDIDSDHTITIGSSSNPKAGVLLKFDKVNDLCIESNTPIKILMCSQWLDNDTSRDYIKAPSLGTLQVRGDKKLGIAGDLDVDVAIDSNVNSVKVAGILSGEWNCNAVKSIKALNLDTFNLNLNQEPDSLGKILALGTLNVKGSIYGSNIQSAGHIRKVRAAIMADSNCFAGVAEGITGLPSAEADSFENTSTIKSISVKGIKGVPEPYFINSNIAAVNILNASIVYPQSDNGGVPFGLCADYIKKLTIKNTDGVKTTLNEPDKTQTLAGVEIRLY